METTQPTITATPPEKEFKGEFGTVFKILEVLPNSHSSPETAFNVPNYPYGFTARTTIRYWIERDLKHSKSRLCAQTLNPRSGQWNKPKKSTYQGIMKLYKNEEGHVKTLGIDFNTPEPIARAFAEIFTLTEEENHFLELIIAWDRGQKNITWTCTSAEFSPCEGETIPDEPRQTIENQLDIMRASASLELRKMREESKEEATL